MLLRELKTVANEALFTPNKCTPAQKVLIDVGSPSYWTTKAIEKIMEAQRISEGSVPYHNCIIEATQLLILTRTFLNEKDKKPKKARKRTSRKDNESV